MSKFISGKEAWIAKSENKDVQYKIFGLCEWQDLTDKEFMAWDTSRFLDTNTAYKFRLKPKTIKLNNIEVPAPFEPKEGDEVWVISDYRDGYHEVVYNGKVYNDLGRWRTEEEIKQVVEALKSVFKPQ